MLGKPLLAFRLVRRLAPRRFAGPSISTAPAQQLQASSWAWIRRTWSKRLVRERGRARSKDLVRSCSNAAAPLTGRKALIRKVSFG